MIQPSDEIHTFASNFRTMTEINSHHENDPVASRKVLEMLTIANEFCLFMEKSAERTRDELLQFLQKICPLIYLKASLLPDITVSDEEAVQHYVTEEQWEELFNLLRNKFGDVDEFFAIDHHEHSHHDPVKASISEHITDIYQDMKDFVLLYQNPLRPFRENAVLELKHLFETRTGFRLVNLMQIIHYLISAPAGNCNFDE